MPGISVEKPRRGGNTRFRDAKTKTFLDTVIVVQSEYTQLIEDSYLGLAPMIALDVKRGVVNHLLAVHHRPQ